MIIGIAFWHHLIYCHEKKMVRQKLSNPRIIAYIITGQLDEGVLFELDKKKSQKMLVRLVFTSFPRNY